jgi:hypothetical protein
MTTYRFNALPTLRITARCKVTLVESTPGVADGETRRLSAETQNLNDFVIEVETNSDDVTVYQQGLTLVVEQKNIQSGGINIIGGSIITTGDIVGRSIHIGTGNYYGNSVNVFDVSESGININTGGGKKGKVRINGVLVDLDALPEAEPEEEITIRIVLPRGSNLDGRFYSPVENDVTFDSVNLEMSNTASILVNAQSLLSANLSNNSRLSACVTGILIINASNDAKAVVSGTFANVNVNASNDASVTTSGICEGPYIAVGSNNARIGHQGTVKNRITRNASNNASVQVY